MANDCHYLENGLSYCCDWTFFFVLFFFPCALTCKGMYGEKNCRWTKVVVFGPQTAEKKTVRKLKAALMIFELAIYC